MSMIRILRRAWLPASAACLLALAPVQAVAQAGGGEKAVNDTVKLADGTTQAGLIQSEEFTGLTIKVGSKPPTTIQWKDVRETSYRQADDYAAAQAALQADKLDEAEAAFRTMAANTKMRGVVRQQVLYTFAILLQQRGKADESTKALHDLVDEFPHGRYLGTAGEILVGARVAAKDFTGATAEVTRLETATKDYAEFRPSINVLKGLLLEAQGKLTDAATVYGTVGIAPGVQPEVKAQADLGTARVLVAQNKPKDAEDLLRKLVAQDLPGRVLSAAWNGLGDLVADRGKKAKDADMILEAAFDYLRSSVQYPPLAGEPTREYERGLAGSARCFRYIADLEQNPERKELYNQRAQARAELLRKEYPDSEFLSSIPPGK
jgi:predicted Zn-dependent protease